MNAKPKPAETNQAPLTEPRPIICKFITGGAWEVTKGVARWVAWVELPQLGGEMQERRIEVRIAMTRKTARDQAQAVLDELDRGD